MGYNCCNCWAVFLDVRARSYGQDVESPVGEAGGRVAICWKCAALMRAACKECHSICMNTFIIDKGCTAAMVD